MVAHRGAPAGRPARGCSRPTSPSPAPRCCRPPPSTARRVIAAGGATLPGVWAAAPVLAWAVLAGGAPGLAAAVLRGAGRPRRGPPAVGVHARRHRAAADRGQPARLGGRAAPRRPGRRWPGRSRCRPPTRERERLAARHPRLACCRCSPSAAAAGAQLGGEAARLGRLAGEQEVGCASLVAAAPAAARGRRRRGAGGQDLRRARPRSPRRTSSSTGPRPARCCCRGRVAARACAAAVGAALDNVAPARRATGARAWMLLEDEPTSGDRDRARRRARLRRRAGWRRPRGEGRLGVRRRSRAGCADLGGTVSGRTSRPGRAPRSSCSGCVARPKRGAAQRRSPVTEPEGPVGRPGLRVMVVDDHPIWRDAVARDLADGGPRRGRHRGRRRARRVRRAPAAAPGRRRARPAAAGAVAASRSPARIAAGRPGRAGAGAVGQRRARATCSRRSRPARPATWSSRRPARSCSTAVAADRRRRRGLHAGAGRAGAGGVPADDRPARAAERRRRRRGSPSARPRSCGWSPRACRTGRSPSGSCSRTGPCRTTSRTRWPSCSCTTASSWPATRSSRASTTSRAPSILRSLDHELGRSWSRT